MLLFKFKPITNGIRHQIKIQKSILCKNARVLKSSQKGFKKFVGRSSGVLTSYHKGGGGKSLHRRIAYNQFYYAIVVAILYDSNRSAFLSLNYNLLKNTFFFTQNIDSVAPGSLLFFNKISLELKLGFRLNFQSIPLGGIISCISTSLKSDVKYSTSAGAFGQLVQKNSTYSKVRLPSGKLQLLANSSYATLGTVSNFFNNKVVLGKAGKARLLGRRPIVRGVAMNPVDHPHGGRTNGGRPSVTPWGKPTKGMKTVKRVRYN